MRRRWHLIAIIVALSSVIVGCGGDDDDDLTPSGGAAHHRLYVDRVYVNEQDRWITCVIYDDNDYEQGGLSCDWSER